MKTLNVVLIIIAIFLVISMVGGVLVTMIDVGGGYKSFVFANSEEELMSRFDVNNDGVLDFDEYYKMHSEASLGTVSVDTVESNFEAEDVNHDGVIGPYEISLNWLNDVYNYQMRN